MRTSAHLVAVCSGQVAPVGEGRRRIRSAIDKRPREGRVEVGLHGVADDGVGDPQHHGGVEQALYAYAEEDAAFWAAERGRPVPPGALGENLRVDGLDVTGSRVGDRWRIGEVEAVVTGPRIPCATFATYWDEPDLVARFLAAGRPGAYLRVLVPGTVAAGDPVEVVAGAPRDVSVADVSRILTRDRDEAAVLLDLPDLVTAARDWAAARCADG